MSTKQLNGKMMTRVVGLLLALCVFGLSGFNALAQAAKADAGNEEFLKIITEQENALKLLEAGDYEKAMISCDEAEDILKGVINKLKNGDPLERKVRDTASNLHSLKGDIYKAWGMKLAQDVETEIASEAGAVDATQDEYMFGPSLLVHPVTSEGAKSVKVYLPAGIWYDFDTYQPSAGGNTVEVETPLSKVPIFYRGGSIVPTRQRQRRSTTQQAKDPFTLFVAPDADGNAEGSLYIDDGKTFDYEKKGAYDMLSYHLKRDNGVMTLTGETKKRAYETPVGIERIVIMGVSSRPTSVTFTSSKQASVPVTFFYDEASKVLTLKKPVSSVLDEWHITIA